MLALLMLLLFAVTPVAIGYLTPHVTTARIAWLALGALLTYSQARDDELGGAWVPVGLVVLLGLLLVELGHRLRRRGRAA